MPFKDQEKKREYDRVWQAKRRFEWFSDKFCIVCGSTESLELDHIDPIQKVTHRIWSWSSKRRETELNKCQVLCETCHVIKTKENRDSGFLPGENHIGSKLTTVQVLEIRSLAGVIPYRQIARQYGIALSTVSEIINRKWWTHI